MAKIVGTPLADVLFGDVEDDLVADISVTSLVLNDDLILAGDGPDRVYGDVLGSVLILQAEFSTSSGAFFLRR